MKKENIWLNREKNCRAILIVILCFAVIGRFININIITPAQKEELISCPVQKVEALPIQAKQIIKIKVRKGWYLSKIADGLGASVKVLVVLNKIENPDLIYAGQTIKVIPYDKTNRVKVSWYGPEFHGKKMSNGEIFNMEDPTVVAHKLLPFGTRVRLTRKDNGKSIMVVVQDRGPYVKGRDFDISRKAAERLGIIRLGIALCEVKILN